MSAQLSRATREAAIKAANDKGCIVVEPKPNQLFIDIDNIDDLDWFRNKIARISSRTPLTYVLTPSPSGKPDHLHAFVTFEKLTFSPLERIAYQAALGSDRGRELNSICDILDEDPLPTIFFEREIVMWGGVEMVVGKCPQGSTCLACDRLGSHLEPRGDTALSMEEAVERAYAMHAEPVPVADLRIPPPKLPEENPF